MRRLGMQLVQEKKAAVMASISSKKGVTTSDVHDRDLLSLLIKANMSSDIPAHQRMSDEDVLARMFFTSFPLDIYTDLIYVPWI